MAEKADNVYTKQKNYLHNVKLARSEKASLLARYSPSHLHPVQQG